MQLCGVGDNLDPAWTVPPLEQFFASDYDDLIWVQGQALDARTRHPVHLVPHVSGAGGLTKTQSLTK
jgi:hypothetical protein